MSETIKKLRSEFKTDFQQFAYRCLKIRTKTNGVVPFELNSVQLDLLDKFENAMRFDGRARFIVLKARQMGLLVDNFSRGNEIPCAYAFRQCDKRAV